MTATVKDSHNMLFDNFTHWAGGHNCTEMGGLRYFFMISASVLFLSY